MTTIVENIQKDTNQDPLAALNSLKIQCFKVPDLLHLPLVQGLINDLSVQVVEKNFETAAERFTSSQIRDILVKKHLKAIKSRLILEANGTVFHDMNGCSEELIRLVFKELTNGSTFTCEYHEKENCDVEEEITYKTVSFGNVIKVSV